MTSPAHPPKLWTRLLRLMVPRKDANHVERELAELYQARVDRLGRAAADGWYRAEVLGFFTVRFHPRRRTPHTYKTGGSLMRDAWGDIVRAFRSIRHDPGFAGVAIVMLTLGIGANTVIFSIVDHVAFRALPYEEPQRLVKVWHNFFMVRGELDVIEQRAQTLESVGGFLMTDGFNLTTDDGSRRVQGHYVSASFLTTLGINAQIGRRFLKEETTPGGDAVVMLASGFWRDEYGANPTIVGSTVTLDGIARTVVGVLPDDFAFPDPHQQVLVPLTMDPGDVGTFWGSGGIQAIGRLATGATTLTTETELRSLSEDMRLMNPLWTPNAGYRDQARVVPMHEAVVGGVESTLMLLFGAVGIVFLVACANVSNLLLARGIARERDVALKSALGAGRSRLIREHLAESLVLAAVGTSIAFFIAHLTLDAVVGMLPPEIPRAREITLDGRVLGIGVVFALVAGTVAGVFPAIRGSSVAPVDALREGGRGGIGGRRTRRVSSGLVVAQVAAAVVLVIGAGLMARSLGALGDVDPGFRTSDITTARLTLDGSGLVSPESQVAFYERVLTVARSQPGVIAAGLGRRIPFGPGAGGMATFFDGVTQDPNDLPILNRNQVMPGYLETLGVQLVSGRMLSLSDGVSSPLVAVIDETAATQFWPGEDPVGRRLRYPWRGAPWIEIVGVVGGISDGALGTPPRPGFYVPMAQAPTLDATLVMQLATNQAVSAATIREIVHQVDPRVAVSRVEQLHNTIAESTAQTRWTTVLLSVFAVVTLTLGCVGVYGVVAYSVRARTSEIGVRMALGATHRNVQRGVLRSGLALTVPGAIVGLVLAIPAVKLLQGLLFGVSALDPVTFAIVPFCVVLVGTVAVAVPAQRATAIDPIKSLRGR